MVTARKSRLKRWCPIWHLALKGNRLLRDERIAHRQTRQEAAVANARADHEQARRLDVEARCRRSEDILDLLTRARCDEIAKREGAG